MDGADPSAACCARVLAQPWTQLPCGGSWYVKAAFEASPSCALPESGYAVLLTDLTRVWWQQLNVVALVKAMEASAEESGNVADEDSARDMMEKFAKAFEEPRVAGYEFRAERADAPSEDAVLRLKIMTEDEFDEDAENLQWMFAAAALAWVESAALLRDTFIAPLISVKQQLDAQKMDLAELIVQEEQKGGGGGGGATNGHRDNQSLFGQGYGSARRGDQGFALDVFNEHHVEKFRQERAAGPRASAAGSAAAPSNGTAAEADLFAGFAGGIYAAHVAPSPSSGSAIDITGDDSATPHGGSLAAGSPSPSKGRGTLRANSASPGSTAASSSSTRSPGKRGAGNRHVAISDSDDSDDDAAALFADEPAGGSTQATQQPRTQHSLLDMADDNYTSTQRPAATQRSISPAVSAPRGASQRPSPAAGKSQAPPKGGSKKKKVAKKKRRVMG